jgi:uncharacterized protein YcbK (DUF882 family)
MSTWKASTLSRRGFLRAGAGLGLVVLNDRAHAGQPERTESESGGTDADRALDLYAPHLDERFSGAYWAGGAYVGDALAQISWLMRDHAADEPMPIDPGLLDTLHALGATLDCTRPIEILSGYRTPETNRALRREGAAKNSLHVLGKAADVRIPGRPLTHVVRAAIQLGAGGVGCYPRQHFLHLDTGPVRRWTSWRGVKPRKHRGHGPGT